MLEYIHVRWRHDHLNQPVEMLYEVLPDRNVPRMVEVFADGRAVASALRWERQQFPGSDMDSLIDGPMSEIGEIPDDGTFVPGLVTKQAFEAAFENASPIINTKETTRNHP